MSNDVAVRSARPAPLGPTRVPATTARLLVGAAVVALAVGVGCTPDRDDAQDRISPADQDGTSSTVAPGPPPQLTDSACPEPGTPAGPDDRITCQVLVVPEDRAHPEDRQVELPVLTFEPFEHVATSPAMAAAPVVHLHGGPGGGAVEQWATWSTDADALGTDVVVYDQRGGGDASPALDCPEHQLAALDALADDGDPTEEQAVVADAIERCHDRLRDDGVDLDRYDIATSVADLEDLRRALGAERLRLVAGSYGTRLALEYAAAHPDRVAALALDSIDPPGSGHPGSDAEQVDPAITRLIDACDADPACAAAHPDLGRSLDTALARADAAPLTIAVTDLTSGEPGRLVLTGDDLRAGLFAAMYDSELVPLLPLAIEAVARGDDALLSSVGPRLAPALSGTATGALMSAICADRTAEPPPWSEVDLPEGTGTVALTSGDPYCDRWPVERTASAAADVDPTAPVLVVAGELDPITPAATSRRLAQRWEATYVEVPRAGHAPMFATPCTPRRAALLPRGSDSAGSRLRCDDGADALRVTRGAGDRRRAHGDPVEILSTSDERRPTTLPRPRDRSCTMVCLTQYDVRHMASSDPTRGPDGDDTAEDAALSTHLQELRRGTTVLACLEVLRQPGYGYGLLEQLESAGFEVQGNTLYPLLRRLESQGLLESDWNTDESRPRKFYRTTAAGDAVAAALLTDWNRLNLAIEALTEGDTP